MNSNTDLTIQLLLEKYNNSKTLYYLIRNISDTTKRIGHIRYYVLTIHVTALNNNTDLIIQLQSVQSWLVMIQ